MIVDTEKCTGCKKCITEIGCPGIGFDPSAEGPRSKGRGQAFVDAAQCNGCGLCTQVCPFGSIVSTAASSAGSTAPSSEGGAHA